jgi:hypothetical protein
MWASKAMRRASTVTRVACAALVIAVLPSGAHAQRTALTLSVARDPQGCVHEAALRAHLDRFLRVHGPIDVEVVVHADAKPVGFELRHGGAYTAERRFEVLPTGCPARLDALALAIAVAVENAVGPERASVQPSTTAVSSDETAASASSPQGASEDAATEPPLEARPEPPATEPKPDTPVDEAAPEPPSAPLAITFAPILGAGMLLETLLEPALAVHGGSEVRLGSLVSVSVAALFAPGVEVELGTAGASSSLLGGRALGCLGSAPRGLRLEGCAGAAGGAVFASGKGATLEKRSEPTVGWVAAVLRAAVSVPAHEAIGVRLALDGHYNLVRPGLMVEGTPAVERVVGALGLAASLEVWFALR